MRILASITFGTGSFNGKHTGKLLFVSLRPVLGRLFSSRQRIRRIRLRDRSRSFTRSPTLRPLSPFLFRRSWNGKFNHRGLFGLLWLSRSTTDLLPRKRMREVGVVFVLMHIRQMGIDLVPKPVPCPFVGVEGALFNLFKLAFKWSPATKTLKEPSRQHFRILNFVLTYGCQKQPHFVNETLHINKLVTV